MSLNVNDVEANYTLFREIFFQLVQREVKKNDRALICSEFDNWMERVSSHDDSNKLTSFELTLISSMAEHIMLPDDYFYVCSQFGQISEQRVGVAGYTLILVVLYARYLYNIKGRNTVDVYKLNHGIMLNMNHLPFGRVVIDVDIVSDTVTKSAADHALKFFVYLLLHFVEKGSKVLVTKNMDVLNSSSFHLITENQFDIISVELVKKFCATYSTDMIKVDLVFMWALPNGRYHQPQGYYYLGKDDLNDKRNFNSVAGKKIEYCKFQRNNPLRFEEWMLMAPVTVSRIDSVFSILKETNSVPANNLYMRLHKNKAAVSYMTLEMKDSIEDMCATTDNVVERIPFLKIFNKVRLLDIPRRHNDKEKLLHMNMISVCMGSLRLIFAPHRQSLFERSFASPGKDEIEKIWHEEAATEQYTSPSEFYEILLHTKISIDPGCSLVDIFANSNGVDEEDLLHHDSTTLDEFSDLIDPSHKADDRIEKFFNLSFTYTFKARDIKYLNTFYNSEKFCYNGSLVDRVCASIWQYCTRTHAVNKVLLQMLYLYYCQKNDIPMYIDEHEYEQIMTECSEHMLTPNFPNCPRFGGKLSHRSQIGHFWPEYSGNMNTKIMLHILKISVEKNHTMATLALLINSGVWKNKIVRWSSVFLIHLFEKNSFLAEVGSMSEIHVTENPELQNEAPLKMLYIICSYWCDDLKQTTLAQTIQLSYRFPHLAHLLLDVGSTESIVQVFDNFTKIAGLPLSEDTPDSSSHRSKKRKRTGDESSGVSVYSNLYASILQICAKDIFSFVVDYVVPCYRIVYFTYIYDCNRYVPDFRMDESFRNRVPELIDTEPSSYNYWYRREMGIYNSFLGTFDAHSPALFSGVTIKTPSFVRNNMCVFNMFDMHLKNRLFTILAKGIHFCDFLDYQKTALILCGTIYNPSIKSTEEKFQCITSSLQVCTMDLHANLPCPPQLFDELQKTTHLKYIYYWYYMILCEMSKSLTLDINHPAQYILSFMDPNNNDACLTTENVKNDDSINSSHLLMCVEPEFIENESSILKMVHLHIFSLESKLNDEDQMETTDEPTYLTSILPAHMNNQQNNFLPYNNVMMSPNIWNMDNMWIETMNAVPDQTIMQRADINEKIIHNIQTLGGRKFELFILLNVSWHIRMLHDTPLNSTRYMEYIKKNRIEIYKELIEIVERSIGPFFLSDGQDKLIQYFKKFTESTSLSVDPLDFHLEPKPGYLIPVPNDKTQLGEQIHELDHDLHAGVLGFIIQAQLNRLTIVDKLKMVCKFTRPINRERTSVGLLNRPRTGKNAFVEKLTTKLFPSYSINSYRYNDLMNCENENGNKLLEAFNSNLLVSFDEVESLANQFKTLSNNSQLTGRRLYAVGNAILYINSHIIFMANKDPVCSDAAIIDRIKVFDRYFQFTSFNADAVFPRVSAIHDVTTSEINATFANQCLLQTLPTESANVDEFGLYTLVWQMATLFGHTQQEPCTQRWTAQMKRTMSRFVHSTDPALYIITHKIQPTTMADQITMTAFKQCVQAAISQDRTIPRNNLPVVLHDILDRMKSYTLVHDNGVEYITARVIV